MGDQVQHKFYILVPVYNAEKYIDACIRSVLDQTYDNFRLILVDDGTPDRSGEICDVYAAKDSRITVIHKANGGQTSARNAAISQMFQEMDADAYAVFLDSDDKLKPHALRTLNDTICAHQCDMVIYGMDRVYNGKVLYKFQSIKSFTGAITSKRELYRVVFLCSDFNALCRKAVHGQLLKKMMEGVHSRYYHIRLGEDLLQSIPLYEHCEKAVFIPESLYDYTFNPDSVSNNCGTSSDFLDSTVRSTVLAFLERQPEWTQTDMDAYLRYCRKLLTNSLLHIAKLKAGRQEKVKLFAQIKADAYYSKILRTAGNEDMPLYLFKNGKYGLLLLYLNTYNLAASGKRAVRKLLAR